MSPVSLQLEVKGQRRPIHTAAEQGNLCCLRSVRQLCGVSSLFVAAKGGFTALHFASRQNHIGVIAFLIDELHQAAAALPRDKLGRTPAHLAARSGAAEALDMLVTRWPKCVTSSDSSGATPAHCAAFAGHLDCLKKLTQVDPSVLHATDRDGETPCTIAYRCDQQPILEWLTAMAVRFEPATAVVAARCRASGTFNVSFAGIKRWQRECFMAAAAPALLRQTPSASDESRSRIRCVLLDDVALGRCPPCASEAPDGCLPALSFPYTSTRASCAGDVVAHGLCAAESVLVPNPSREAVDQLAELTPGLRTVVGRSSDALAACSGTRSLAAVWLDYCDALNETNQRDLDLLFGNASLDEAGACVAVTFSWRGAPGSRVGGPKTDGKAYLIDFGSAIERAVVSTAERATCGWSVNVLQHPVQCGQLFFGCFWVSKPHCTVITNAM
jgi:hypothetical protein